MESLRAPQERVEKYATWLAHYQLLLLPGAGGGGGTDAAAIEVRARE